MIQQKSWLKWLFRQGAKPTESSYADLIDSMVHINDLQAANTQQFNQKLNTYDQELKMISGGQYVLTVGDVLAAFNSFPRSWRLADKIGAAAVSPAWSTITSKPAQLPVRWTEQILETSNLPSTGVGQGYNFAWGWLAASFGAPAGSSYHIVDVYVQRKTTPENNNFTLFDGITKVKIGLNPYVTP